MKKHIYTALILGSIVYIFNPAKAAIETNIELQLQVDILKKDGIDPVCKMKVKAGSTRIHTHNKIIYGFCSDGCKKSFIKQPEKYIKTKF